MIRCTDCRFRVPSTVIPGMHHCQWGPPMQVQWVETPQPDGSIQVDCRSVFPTVAPDNPNYGCSRGRRKFWDYLWRMTT